MGEVGFADGTTSGAHVLEIDTIEAPLVLCSSNGRLQFATPLALALLRRVSSSDELPASVPAALWRLLEREKPGDAVEWRPTGARQDVLSCTRYFAARGSYLVLMREASAKHLALAERLHRQRVDSTERLVASIAHNIRSAVASVVYSAEFLGVRGGSVEPPVMVETLHDIAKASQSLQLTVDALLDFARLGPTISVPVSLRDVLNRAHDALRVHYRDGAHRLRMDIAPRAEWVRGNPLVLEQIFVNLLLNAIEASTAPRCVIVTAFPAPMPREARSGASFYICVRVWDDGPGIPSELRPFVFDRFFTTKHEGCGLGLAIAREAAENLDGKLELSDDESGTCFSVYLPSGEGAA